MLIADSYLGHREIPAVADQLDDTDLHYAVLSDTERRRSRVRTETTDGQDLGIVVSRDLENGDVLETGDSDLIVVELETVEALVLDFAETDVAATEALALGHAVGNRHWNLAVQGSEVLFPVFDSRDRMESTIENLLPDDVGTHYEPVSPATFDGSEPDHTHNDSTHEHTHGPAVGDHNHSGGDDGHTHQHIYDNSTINLNEE